MNSNYNFSLTKLSAVPIEGIVDELHTHYKFKLINNLNNLTDYAENVLNKKYQIIKDKLASIEKNLENHFISPWLYYSYFKLCDFMDEGNVSEVIKLFSALEDAKDQEFYFSNQKIQMGLLEQWEHQILREELMASYSTDKLMPTSAANDELILFRASIENTLKLIGEVEPVFLQEIQSLVSTILLINSVFKMEGATSPKFFGSVYLSIPKQNYADHPLLVLADGLVHEMSHLYLNTIIACDPLVLNEINNQFISPIRPDLRPMLGIYHAVFVLSRSIRLFMNIDKLNLYPNRIFLKDFTKILVEQYESAYQTVKTHGVLTEIGKQILESTKECAFL